MKYKMEKLLENCICKCGQLSIYHHAAVIFPDTLRNVKYCTLEITFNNLKIVFIPYQVLML